MDKAMTIEEKIRRAEEIYERRKQGVTRPVATVNISQKKDIKLIKKMVMQLLICVSIYLVIYTIQNNNYIFTQDFINKANEILSYDTNFGEIYEIIKNKLQEIIPSNNSQQQAIGGAKEEGEENQDEKSQETNQEGKENQEGEVNQKINENQEQAKTIEEQEIEEIKNTTSFIKPIEGTITSPFGHRESSQASVPKNHTGTDIAANLGTKIKAATGGEVVLASEEGDYGKHLKIQIGEVSVLYAHCNNLYVKQGDKIEQGQEIAEVGSTRKLNRTTPSL